MAQDVDFLDCCETASVRVSEILFASLLLATLIVIEQLRENVMGFVKPVIILGLAAILLLLEPDFGSWY